MGLNSPNLIAKLQHLYNSCFLSQPEVYGEMRLSFTEKVNLVLSQLSVGAGVPTQAV